MPDNAIGTIRIKLVRSPICTPEKQKLVVKGLGLRKLNQVVTRPDTPVFRGMVKKVPHLLVVVEEIPAGGHPAKVAPALAAPVKAVAVEAAPVEAAPVPAAAVAELPASGEPREQTEG
jgi:large subunit ribosomal protein L30